MLRKYSDLHIYSNNSIGNNSIKEIVETAEKLELSTIALLDAKDKKNIDKIKKEIGKVNPKISVLIGTEIIAGSITELTTKIKKMRPLVDILAVYGGNLEINKVAVEDPRVDILTHPELKRRDSGLDEVMIKEAAKNKVGIELNFREFLYSYGKTRTHILRHMRHNVRLAMKYKAPIIITSGAENIGDMRSGRELSSIGHLCDMQVIESLDAVSKIPEEIIENVKQKKSEKFIMPGVELK